jgi:HTH-type transcriptional regulator/antitoxin HigA
MEPLKYTIVKTLEQYYSYCDRIEELTSSGTITKNMEDEIDLLVLLIEKWDEEHNTLADLNPVQTIRYLMTENKLKATDLANTLAVSKGLVSDILNYKKGLSKDIIRALSSHFKLSQEIFNRPYKLKSALNTHLRNASVMNTMKELA